MQLFKKYIILTFYSSVIAIGLAYTFNHYFFIELHKEAKNFTKDKYQVTHLSIKSGGELWYIK